MIVHNNYHSAIKAKNKLEYDARISREYMAGFTTIPVIDIYVDILANHKGEMKREEMISHFSVLENCTYNAATELFNRIRPEFVNNNPHIFQPNKGYYQFI